jgi:hypothetical protein
MQEKGKKETAEVIYFVVFVNCDGVIHLIPYPLMVHKCHNCKKGANKAVHANGSI